VFRWLVPIFIVLALAQPATAEAREALVVFGTAIKPKLLRRLQSTLELARKRPHARIIVTGGSAASLVPEARIMTRWLSRRGIDSRRILVEPRARHTGENADLVVPLLKRIGASDVTVVTSRQHARRAGFHMRAALSEAGLFPRRVKVSVHGAPDGLSRIGRFRAWWGESFKIARDAGIRLKRRLSRHR
jgi:uncharacterized SAM-binding protein YcdF (DUF218 family)